MSKNLKRAVTMDAEAFAADRLSLLDEVYKHNIEIIITRNGKPIVRVIRFVGRKPRKKMKPLPR
ncbi:MAG TPA: type II toxin-antitoxin system prevent-host-death family antitoxin [Acidobacteriaceae bacterium]|nr:type II toxin-antitoxin system prevent-host-death family antitoxin [Acidobacteriaceae bacterium]